MAKLQKDKAFNSNEINEFLTIGAKTLQTAKEVSEGVEDCLKTITALYDRIPEGAKEDGVRKAAGELEKSVRKGDYSWERTRLQKTLSRINQSVPQYDKKCAGQLQQLAAACDRIQMRIAGLEQFLAKEKTDLSPDRFQEELARYRKTWEQEGRDLARLLQSVKAGLQGLETVSCRYSKDPVNLSTGNFIYDRTDLAVKGEPGLAFRRFYNAQESRKGVMGSGWIHNYEIHIEKKEQGIRLYMEDGKAEDYEREDGILKSIRGSLGILRETEEGYLYETADGSRYRFDREGTCIRYEDSRGNGLCLDYDEGGRLVRVREEAQGDAAAFLSYAYDEAGQLAEVTDHTGRSIRLSYREGRLEQVEAPEGTCYAYRYDKEGRLTQVTNAAEVMTVKNTYDREGRVTKQVFPDGSRMRYRYLDAYGQVELTERNGAKTIYCHDALYRNTKTIYEDGEETWTYNRNNQKTSHTDKNGNRTMYGYDGWGNLTKVVDALGNATTMLYNGQRKLLKLSVNGKEKLRNHYDSLGNLMSATDGEGNTTEFWYDEKKRPVCILQPDGSRIHISYDEKGNIVTLTDAAGTETAYGYDGRNRITESRDGNGNVTRYGYNEKDELTTVTNAEGNTRTYAYNHGGKVTRIVDFDGSVTEFSYNCLNRMEQATDQEGNRTRYAYDRMWNVSEIQDAEGGKTGYAYDRNNRLETVVDAEGNRTTYTYDACGNRTGIQGACGEQTLFSYDALHRPVKRTEPDGAVTEYTYDAEGNMTEVRDSMGNLRKMLYNEAGRCISETDGKGRTVRYEYDAMGNMVRMTDAAGRKTAYGYQKGGILEQVTYPDGTWERYVHDGCGNVIRKERTDGSFVNYVYDCLNRLVRLEGSAGQKKCFRYDAVGNVTSVLDAAGNETVYRYDRRGNLTGVTDAEGGSVSCRYDRNGRLAEILQPGREGEEARRTRYTRDRLGRVTGVEDALGRTERYVYDQAGRLAEKLDRDGNRTAYAYNMVGQPSRITYGDGKEAEFSYDALRRLKEVKDWLGTMTFTHDEEGRLTGATDQRGKEVRYRYGAFGEREAVLYPDGREVLYGYDELLRLKSLKSGSLEAVYRYDAMGRLAARQTSEGVLTEYGYDAAGLLSSLVHTGAEGVLESYRYGYDPAGNRIREERYRKGLERESGIYTYGYDRLHRLVRTAKDGETVRTYRYDSFGNRTEKREGDSHSRYTYNALNQLVHDTDGLAEHRYEYDNRGNLVRTLENGSLEHAYEFGAMNRMTRAADRMGNVAEYHYNGLGHRTGMRQGMAGDTGIHAAPEPGTGGFPFQTPEVWDRETEYVLDVTKGYHNLLQKEEKDRVQSYIWDSEAVFLEENGQSYSYLNDMQGSIMRLLDCGGQGTISYGYDEFGADLLGNQGQFQPLGYTGYQKDTVAGTYYAQAREYDAWTGRFTSEDIIKGYAAYPGTLNAYGYCWGNPLILIDKDGNRAEYVYDREKAIEYADEWTDDHRDANLVIEYLFSERNPDYYSYSSNCANFVSQCIEAGGVEMNDDWHSYKTETTSTWVSGSGNHYAQIRETDWDVSSTWRLAQDQYEYFSNPENGYASGKTITVDSLDKIKDVAGNYNVQKGDLMYFVDAEGNIHHATMISKVDNGMIYFTGNTTRRFNMPLDKVLGNESVIIVRIKDVIEFKLDDKCLCE